MKQKVVFPLILISTFFFMGNGCGKRTYYQLIAYDSPTPIIFEVKMDSVRTNAFAGIDYMHMNGYHENEKINIVRLNYQTTNTGKFNLSNFSLQAFYGTYFVKGIDGQYTSDSVYDGIKSGYGARVSYTGGLNFNIKGFRLGIGVEPSVNFDFGEYYHFRTNADRKGVIESNADFIKLNLNIIPYVSIPVSGNSLINMQMNVGIPGFISPIISLQVDNQIFWAGYNVDRMNFGLLVNWDTIRSNF
ncbi:MAG: hypothetical protein ACK4G1_02040 [Ignavibacteria bacterium]